MAKTKYFSGTTPVKNVFPLTNARFAAIGGVPAKGNRYDGYHRLAGHPETGPDATLPRLFQEQSELAQMRCAMPPRQRRKL